METLRLYYNKVRIWLKKRFTDNVRVITVRDPETGKEHTATVETSKEKVCQHKKIEQLYGTIWHCTETANCDVYFEINYKVLLSQGDLIGLAEAISKHANVSINNESNSDDAYDAGFKDGEARGKKISSEQKNENK